ncbi:hypothetical protein BGZ60DRAFT_388903 [Tricladium varicosporioides]|nr:hypothetical protein BGZ60DRAFT_388903 [Hymenoscyphus varicosporioides]
MTKLIVVIGATGGQGGGVAMRFLRDPEWKVRGVTRDVSSEKAKALATKGVEMIEANMNDEASLIRAFQGATAIFAFTDYYSHFPMSPARESIQLEHIQGVNLANAAAKTSTLKHYIWSTLPHTSVLSQGRAVVPHFEGKAKTDLFIKQLLPDLAAKTTFVIFTIFASNPVLYPIFRPIYVESANKYIQMYPTNPQSPYPSMGDHAINSGIFVHSIVTNDLAPPGSYIKCTVEDLTLDSYLAMWGKATGLSPNPGSTMVMQISHEQYCQFFGTMGEEQASQWKFFEAVHELGIAEIEGKKILEATDLMPEEAKKELVKTEDSLRALDWSSFKHHGRSGPVPTRGTNL